MSTLRQRIVELRQRIIEAMPEILELLACERQPGGLWSDEDFRGEVVRRIKTIAELETMPPFKAVRALERVARDVKRLKLSVAGLPPTARRLIELEVKGLDDAARCVETKTGRPQAGRKLAAAEAAWDLMADHGSRGVSLTKNGPYVRLASLLYFSATGRRADLGRSCKQHLVALVKKTEVKYSRRRGPRRRPRDADLAPWMVENAATLASEAEAERRRRREVIKKWLPLEDVVDEALG